MDASRDLIASVRTIVSAPDLGSCHAAIAAMVRFLEARNACRVMAVELAPSARGAAVTWRAGTLADDWAIAEWFVRARNHPSQFLDFGQAGAGVAVVAGAGGTASWLVLLADIAFSSETGRAVADVAHLAVQQLHRLRGELEISARRKRFDGEDTLDAALARAAADLIWECGSDDILHVTHVPHGRRDLARAVEGRRLDEILPQAKIILKTGAPLRAQTLILPGLAEDFLVTAIRGPEGHFRGTIVAGTRQSRPGAEAATLESLMQARRRAERLRGETEAMMLGLRLLLGELSFREKLEQLAQYLGRAIRGDDMRLLHVRPGETPRLLFPDLSLGHGLRRLEVILAQDAPLMVFGGGGDEAAFLREALGMRAGDIILVALPAETERYYLFCRVCTAPTPQDLAMAERISLLLKHALAMQADQQRMIHAGKLSALGQMSTSLAHELRQPLNTISIAAQNIELLLEMDAVTPEILQEKSTRILSQVERACMVMDRMRRFGRKTAGTHVPVSLAAIARSARSLMDKVSSETGIGIEVTVPDGLEIFADELEIEQVLVNLIQNAADAIHEKSREGLIHVFAGDDADPDMVRLHVEDDGPGFQADVQAHALDAFFTTKAQGKGTGLGLSIAHAILREHGGRLLIGNGDKGARVTLVLRRAGVPAKAGPPS
jgi:signal transduction histidine kinase